MTATTGNDVTGNAWTLPPLEHVLAKLHQRRITLPAGNPRAGGFGVSAELSNEWQALIRGGKNRGGASRRSR